MNKVEHAEESPCVVRSKLNSLTMWEVGGARAWAWFLHREGAWVKGPFAEEGQGLDPVQGSPVNRHTRMTRHHYTTSANFP